MSAYVYIFNKKRNFLIKIKYDSQLYENLSLIIFHEFTFIHSTSQDTDIVSDIRFQKVKIKIHTKER